MRVPLLVAALGVLALPSHSDAAPQKIKPAVPAVPAVPAASSENAKPVAVLIESDLDGREMTFLTRAIEIGKTYGFLADQVKRITKPAMGGFVDDLVNTLAAQSKVLNTVAEMRNIRIPGGQGATEGRLAAKFGTLEGARLEKALLDSFRETDRQAVAIYEMGVQSKDLTIRKLCEQTLPKIREHLAKIEAMTGIAPQPKR